MRIGVCAGPEAVAAGISGLDYIEGHIGNMLCPREDDAQFAQRLAVVRAARIPVEAGNCFIPGDLKCTGAEVNNGALDQFVGKALERAAKAGLKIIVFGSGGSRQVPEGFEHAKATEQLVAHLKRWGPMAARAGVTICLEPLQKAECNIVNSVTEGADIIRRANQVAIRLLADTYHMGCDGEGPDAIRRARGLIAHVHCAEVDGRGPLGAKGENQRPYFKALKDIGYTGRVSLECGWTDLAAQVPASVAELRKQIETA